MTRIGDGLSLAAKRAVEESSPDPIGDRMGLIEVDRLVSHP